MKMAQKVAFICKRVENNVARGENSSYQHLLPFLQCFPKNLFSQNVNTGDYLRRVRSCTIIRTFTIKVLEMGTSSSTVVNCVLCEVSDLNMAL